MDIDSRDGADEVLAVCYSSSLISRLKIQSCSIIWRRKKKKKGLFSQLSCLLWLGCGLDAENRIAGGLILHLTSDFSDLLVNLYIRIRTEKLLVLIMGLHQNI